MVPECDMILNIISQVLDPRFKVSLFRNNPEYFSDTWVTSCQESMLDRLAEDYPAIDQAVEMGSSLVDVADEFANLMNGVLGSASSTSTPPTSATQELQIYLGEPVFGGDPLAWWKVWIRLVIAQSLSSLNYGLGKWVPIPISR